MTTRDIMTKIRRAEKRMARQNKGVRHGRQGRAIENRVGDHQSDGGDSEAGDAEVEEWTAPLPEPTPEDVQTAVQQSLRARHTVTDEDIDRLWDWVRVDEDRGAKFLGFAPKTSTEVRARLAAFGEHLYALEEDTLSGEVEPAGFIAFSPVMDTWAHAHIYLAPAIRGRAPHLIKQLMEMASGEYPGKEIVVITPDAAMGRMLRSLGFSMRFLMAWRAPGELAETVTVAPQVEPMPSDPEPQEDEAYMARAIQRLSEIAEDTEVEI